ncbi:FtsX-like permease family protein, partial [Kibdelosporangium lantanae]
MAKVLNIVAHHDDDLLFLSPTLMKDLRDGNTVRTVFLVASDYHTYPTYMQATEDSVSGGEDMGRTIAMGNYAVVTMILGFAALVLVNTLVAATSRRRAEFGLLRVAGSTRTQVLRSLG